MSNSWSEYIVYVDESGDHGMRSMDSDYPIFVLAFCIFAKNEYAQSVTPDLQQFKFKHFGHDMVILHEHEIRKADGEFRILVNKQIREDFMADITQIVESAKFTIIASIIRKDQLKGRFGDSKNPYDIALKFGLERVDKFLRRKNQEDRVTHVVFEGRGRKEDDALELEFRRVCDGANFTNKHLLFRAIFADKRVNSCGLQLADLVARPIGRNILDPTQKNRAFEVLANKFDRSPSGEIEGWGRKTYP